MDEIRIWIIGALSALAAFISPISGDIYSMVFLFAFNCLFGLVADTGRIKKYGRPSRKLWCSLPLCFSSSALES